MLICAIKTIKLGLNSAALRCVFKTPGSHHVSPWNIFKLIDTNLSDEGSKYYH